MKKAIGLIGLTFALVGLSCQQGFVLKVTDINFDTLGSGRLFISSRNLLQNYYIDVAAQEAYYVPLPTDNSSSFAIDGAGKYIYVTSESAIYRAELGVWRWEKLAIKLPHASPLEGRSYYLDVSPDNQRLYFIWNNYQDQDRNFVSLDLETGELINLTELTGLDIHNYSINPITGEIAFLIQALNDSSLQFYRMQGDGSDVQLMFTAETVVPFDQFPPNIMNWTPDGKEILYVLSEESFIYRYELASESISKKPFYQELNYYNIRTRIALSPDGERFAYGINDAVEVDSWDRVTRPYDYGADGIIQLCEYSCYTAGKVYWWP